MTTIDDNIGLAAVAGVMVFDRFTLPSSCWWDEYLTPLSHRVAALRPRAADDDALRDVLADAENEIDIVRRFGDSFGYTFFLMRRA